MQSLAREQERARDRADPDPVPCEGRKTAARQERDKRLITISATTNAVTNPIAICDQPTGPVPAASSARLPHSSSADAPNIVGTARKKLNSAAVRRSIPISIAPMMVAPERLTPGTIAIHWNKPTPMAWRAGSWPIPVGGPGLAMRSIARIANPPSTSAIATVSGLPSRTSIYFLSASPRTAEGMNASSRLRTNARLWLCNLSSPMPTAQNVRQYWTTTARIAPSWITTLNTFHCAAS